MSSTPSTHPGAGSLAAAISNSVVHQLSEYTGRGPTKARTYLYDDLVSVVVQDTLTKAERRLVTDGRADVVLTTRKAYQDTMRTDLVAAVESLTGRHVLAFFSDNHIEPDMALESFLLAPRMDQDGSAAQAIPADLGD